MIDDLKVFSGNSNPALAKEICEYLKIPLGDMEVTRFKDGEIYVKINENVRGKDVFIIQSTCPPHGNDNVMELLIVLDALSRASARRITAVIPYYGYGRQDCKDQPRVPITAKLVANLITVAGANRVLTLDLHKMQIQGFFDIPVDHLFAAPVMVDYFSKLNLQDPVMVSPDAGGVARARAYAKRLQTPVAFIDKRRVGPNQSEVMNVIGDVKGKSVIIIDDIIDTAGTIIKATEILLENGAKAVYAGCVHPVLSPPAVERIRASALREVVVTNTIPVSEEKRDPKIKILSVASLLGEAINRIHNETSVSSLFI